MNKFEAARQYYIHKDVENWFKQSLNAVCGVGGLTYQERYHFHLEHVQFISLCGDETTIAVAVETIDKMKAQTQYQIPWMSENLYYVRDNAQMESIVTKLTAKHIKNYEINKSSQFPEAWFQRKDLQVFTFQDLSKTKRRLVNRLFMQLAETYEEPIVSICKPLPFHENNGPPIKMGTNIAASKGAYLKYLCIEDILSLELANKDHRESIFDTNLDQVIQTHLQRQITTPLDITTILKEFKLPTVLTYFLYKYRDLINATVVVPSILSRNDIRTLTQFIGIQFSTDNNLLPTKTTFNTQNTVSSDLVTKYLRPVDGYHIFHNFNDTKNMDNEIRNTIVLRKRMAGGTSVLLNEIFTNLYAFLSSQNSPTVDLHMIGIDIRYLDENFISRLALFHNIIFQEMSLTSGTFSACLQNESAKISCFDCQILIEKEILRTVDIKIRTKEIVFKHMTFTVDQLIVILSKCTSTRVLFNDCNIIPSQVVNKIGSNPINLSYIEFKYMRFTSDLVKFLCHFGGKFTICFNDCAITNTDICNMYAKAKIWANRIKVLAEHYVNEMIVLELYTEYHKWDGVFDPDERDFDIPAEIIPQVMGFTSKFNWTDIKLRAMRINDNVVKVDMVNNGKVVDWFNVHNGLAATDVESNVNYY